LENIEPQLRSDEMNMVMDCLRNARRFRATASFIADTGLKDAADLGLSPCYSISVFAYLSPVHKYNQLIKDFPLNELLSGTDLDKIHESLILIFGHINRKLRLSPYSSWRCLPLVEAISRDFND
jgi:dynein heavy chain 1